VLGGMLMGFGGGVMLSGLTVSLFVQWLHLPLEFGRGSTSVSLPSPHTQTHNRTLHDTSTDE
jgi:hypothetical protein